MSIQSTRDITRETAIERIKFIADLIENEEYIELQDNSFEEVQPTKLFVYYVADTFTNQMLEEIMDMPFYRFSMFENYCVKEEL